MTVKQMIETLQQHHPHIGETEAIILLNDALADFSERSQLFRVMLNNDVPSVANQLLYDQVALGEAGTINKIHAVYVDGRLATRIQGRLNLKDYT
tara:strand:- start:151 stop:435 length:285 start_codon:yes stop_codon:yes gene_type:complete